MQYDDINELPIQDSVLVTYEGYTRQTDLRALQMALLTMCKQVVFARERLVADVASVIDYEVFFFHVPHDVLSIELYATGIPFTREAQLVCALNAMALEVSRKLVPTK